MPTTTSALVTQDSPRPVIEAEIRRVNEIAKQLPHGPAKAGAHAMLNQLLDWLVGR